MNYDYLNDGNKRELLEQRIANMEGEHYNQSLNLLALQVQPSDRQTDAQIVQTQVTLEGLEKAVSALKSELVKIPKPKPTTEKDKA